MARLREWHYNKNSMLELVRSQKAELPMVAGAEELIMSASDIISSEINVSWIIIDSVLVLRYKHGEFSIMYFPTTNLRDPEF